MNAGTLVDHLFSFLKLEMHSVIVVVRLFCSLAFCILLGRLATQSGMVIILFLCIGTLCQAMRNKENFITELRVLNATENEAGDDGNHHSNTPRNNVNVGSNEFTNASNQSLNEQRVASERHRRWNIDTAQVPDVVCHDLAEDIGKDWKMLGRRLHIFDSHLDNIDRQDHYVREKSISMLNKWQENVGEKATGKVLTETLEEIGRKDLSEKVRDKMLALAKEQLLTEGGLAQCNIETGHTDSSVRSPTQTPPPPESSLTSNTIRHR
ncbi:uncharacterized protein LOC141892241 [Acropora palmata]|uniref:uncharacterized protein LOC141892241 n=1 Tax=Acropora palmata TaxID=6131 RepID=UPI003DA0175F